MHVAIVTGANHGIGAATANVLAARGCAVVCAYWSINDPVDPAIPEAYRTNRATGAEVLCNRMPGAAPVVSEKPPSSCWARRRKATARRTVRVSLRPAATSASIAPAVSSALLGPPRR